MIYLLKSFKEAKDYNNTNNPWLSEEGVKEGKLLKLKNKLEEFDSCYSSFLLKDFGSALVVLGDKMVVDRCHELDSFTDKTLDFIKGLDHEKNILLVSNEDVIKEINKNIESIIIN